ncbi:hypothetical protein VTN00DRAFT_5305 [Thermoascus crustaceus]|uniref:uncharacterized protein n=1 Tax=Thermoascus crustaceus TaxID=5088 RepID=UPI00374264D2
MEYVEHVSNLGTELRAPGYERGDRPFLDPHMEDGKLRFFYGQVADICWNCPSRRLIGLVAGDCSSSTSSTFRSTIIIKDRPLTLNMSELVQMGNFPRSKLPSSTFDTASSYYQMFAETKLVHLSTQRNDAVESEEDCCRKYVARQLFRRLASTSRLSNSNSNNSNTPDTDTGPPFKLFCDDLRPTNILLDENIRIVAVIYWEYSYVAPAEFTYSPPWWLLLEMPEEWPRGISDWIATYQPRLETFLEVLRAREDAAIQDGTLTEAQRLSGRMQESWETGDFWISYGARKSWAFDTFRPLVDRTFFVGARVSRSGLDCSVVRRG